MANDDQDESEIGEPIKKKMKRNRSHGKTSFNYDWLIRNDPNGTQVNKWATRVDDNHFR